ncbi:imidazoleglycerol-phosphate dehydratase [Colletotrichum musicola]|uniref:Imidazoleglycerol-phosphate dehydratase n=3 Tax=Colletotrichum orchidearum species complex TaxID=2707337 RepID=A0A8H6NYS5_9PEZI|nr:imidazoleglycerol-phosphate dehydratase [Colletotrichum sojae]KAF6836179.1 imidazoleglycerol-phosphate dehydratase [Colletotrichum plurivorum]KAF6845132.1 imidazoleglycerol-phosphate dehydratase [Colletotrichum musicola]
MSSHDRIKSAEANDAAWEATRGAVTGALRWGAGAAVLGAVAYKFSPLYKGLTIQFKCYIQMSAMVLGSMLEADHRLREYEARMRMQKRILRDRAKWERFEQEFLENPSSEGKK